jgi:nucleoid-associated protein EbfC
MFNKLKQFKELRSTAKTMQDTLGKESVTIREQNDNIILTMNGNLVVTGLAIDDSLLTPSSKEKLQKGLTDAYNNAIKKMQRIMAVKIKEMGGMPNIPGLS